MPARLENKVAIIIGAGQTPGETVGNGRATAIRFAEEGAHVVLVDRNLASAEETLEYCRNKGGEGYCVEADVTLEAGCRSFIEECVEHYGRVDILHHNVGVGGQDSGPMHLTEEAWDRIFRVNLKGMMFSCKHVLPIMRRQKSGCITNISSVAAVCSVGIVAYKSSKAAMNAYTQSLAIGNARYNIRANVIMPGLMNTPMAIEGYVSTGRAREEVISTRNAAVPLGAQMGDAWDVANAAVFLASDEARFITGVCLPVDGGQSARVG